MTPSGVVGKPAVVVPLRNGLARGRLSVGGLGFGQIDRERADRLAFLDHLESYGEGHTIAEDNVRKSNVTVLGLVLHPRGEAEGVRGDASDMLAEDAEKRAAGDALSAADVHPCDVARLFDDAFACRENVIKGACARGEYRNLARLHARVHKAWVVFEYLAESGVDETGG